jgi:hypothetical protein
LGWQHIAPLYWMKKPVLGGYHKTLNLKPGLGGYHKTLNLKPGLSGYQKMETHRSKNLV